MIPPPRAAATLGEKRRRETTHDYNQAITTGIELTEARANQPSLQLVHLQCNADAITTGKRCKLAGPYTHCGLNYCKRHLNVLTGNTSLNKHGGGQNNHGSGSGQRLLLFQPKTECVMCFNRIKIHDVCATNCGHFFHYDCMRTWMQRSTTCPICKRATQQLRTGNRNCKVVVEIKPKQLF